MENKKVKNATPTKVGDIQFKSILEARLYKTMLECGVQPKYEKRTFTLWKGYRPQVPFYDEDKKHNLRLNMTKLIDITYTPDFTFDYEGILVIVEAKGKQNDVYPYKRKLFRKTLERMKKPVLFFEVYSKRQMLQAMEVIKQKAKQNNEEKIS